MYTVCKGYISSEIGEIAKPCVDRRGRRGSGSQHPNEPYAVLFNAPESVAN